MDSDEDDEFDRRLAAEWQAFGARLGAHVGRMRHGDRLELTHDRATSRGVRGHLVRLERSGAALHIVVADGPVPDDWVLPTGPLLAWSDDRVEGVRVRAVSCDPGECAASSAMVVSVLRDHLGCLSPVYVSSPAAPQLVDQVVREEPALRTPSGPHPSLAELTPQVVRTVAGILHGRPLVDESGNLVIDRFLHRVLVRVATDDGAPTRVVASAHLPVQYDDRVGRAILAVNADLRGCRLVVRDGSVLLEAHVPVRPYVPDHLVDSVELVASSVAKCANRLGEVEVADDRYARPMEIDTLFALGADDDGLDPREVAQVCAADQCRIIDLIAYCDEVLVGCEESAAWARRHGDPDDAEIESAELQCWESVRRSLRAALRVVVLAPARAGG